MPKRIALGRFAGWMSCVCAAAFLLLSLSLVVAVSAQDAPRKLIAKTAPTVPELAKKMHLSGKVKVEVVINPKGSVTAAKLVGGNPVFESSAVEAVKQWKFEPATGSTTAVVVLEFADH